VLRCARGCAHRSFPRFAAMATLLEGVQRFRKIEEATAQKEDPAPVVRGRAAVPRASAALQL